MPLMLVSLPSALVVPMHTRRSPGKQRDVLGRVTEDWLLRISGYKWVVMVVPLGLLVSIWLFLKCLPMRFGEIIQIWLMLSSWVETTWVMTPFIYIYDFKVPDFFLSPLAYGTQSTQKVLSTQFQCPIYTDLGPSETELCFALLGGQPVC